MADQDEDGLGRSRGRARGRLPNRENQGRTRGPNTPAPASTTASGQGKNSSSGTKSKSTPSDETGPKSGASNSDAGGQGRGIRRGMERVAQESGSVSQVATGVPQALQQFHHLDINRTTDGGTASGTGAESEPEHITSPKNLPDALLDKKDLISPATHQNLNTHGKPGKDGKWVQIQTNILHIKTRPKWALYSYRVDFKPDQTDRLAKKKLLHQHDDFLGGKSKYLFDGTKLWTQVKLEDPDGIEDTIKIASETQDGDKVRMRLKYLKQIDENHPIAVQIYNLHFNSYQKFLGMKELKKNYYFPDLANEVKTKGHKFQVWPGLISHINSFQRESGEADDKGLPTYIDMPALLLDTTSKIVRMENMRDVIAVIAKGGGDKQAAVKKGLVGSTVLTNYNNTNYRIDDVDFSKSPLSTFERRGEQCTFMKYYKDAYNVDIKDPKQPLILSRPKKRRGPKDDQSVYLIPELCHPTGLTDAMRMDFTIMKDLAAFTRRTPQQRYEQLKKIHQKLNSNDEVSTMMKTWGIKFVKAGFSKTTGIQLNPETILIGPGGCKKESATPKADWDRLLKSNGLMKAPEPMQKWVFIGTAKAQKEGEEFMKAIAATCCKQGWKVKSPKGIFIKSDKDFVTEARAYIEKNVDFVVLFVPRERKDHYDSVKKLALTAGIASQFVKEKTIKKNMGAVATKVALQMACKMGGEPWAVQMPLAMKSYHKEDRAAERPAGKCMYIGIDAYHETTKKNNSVWALVASLNHSATRWFSTHKVISQTEEIPTAGIREMISLAMGAFKDHNGEYPSNVFVYRDGVGDGCLHRVQVEEVKVVESLFANMKGSGSVENKIRLCYLVVKKRINHKMMLVTNQAKDSVDNPNAGTIVDKTITKNGWYDFFLVSQQSRQGTVTPVHINVIYDQIGLPADKVQKLTFKLTHLYYNWPGTVRVPAPVQYAHKLATLVGDSTHAGVEVNPEMKNKLFFL